MLSSGRWEAFGVVLLEAMAAEVPVLCSDAVGPASVVGDAGLIFRTADVADLAAKVAAFFGMTKPQREQMGTAGAERVNTCFDMSAFRERLKQLPIIEATYNNATK